MKKTSKILSLVMASILSLSFVACGGGDNSGMGDGGGDERDELVLKTNEGATKKVSFEYLQAGFGNDPYIAVANGYMERNPDVQIELIPNRQITSTTSNNLAANQGVADIYSYPYGNILKTWHSNGWLEDLTDLCAQQTIDGRTMLESMTGSAADSMKINDRIYAVPEYTSLTGFIYNIELFEQYGWQIPTTTAELKALCDQILADTNNSVAPIVWCSDAEGYLYFATENWISQYEGIQNMDKFYEFSSPETYAMETNSAGSIYDSKYLALENLVDFFMPMNEGGYAHNNSRTLHNAPAQLKVIDKSAAMMLNGSWFENEMALYLKEMPAKLGMFAVPELSDENGTVLRSATFTSEDDKRVVSADYGAYYFIPTSAANKEQAKDFLLYLSSEEACALYTQYSNAVRPFQYDVSKTSALYSKVGDFGKSVLEMADQHYLYAPVSNNALALKGKGGLWPRGKRVESEITQSGGSTDPNYYLQQDYNFVLSQWEDWMELIGQ